MKCVVCEPCNRGEHEKCVTRDMKSKIYGCKCGCVGNPFVGIVCLTEHVKIPKEEK